MGILHITGSKNKFYPLSFLVFFILFCFPPFLIPLSAATPSHIEVLDPDFPTYPVIKPNIAFWIDIFTKYSTAQGVIHDNLNLDIIYDVVTLDPSETAKGKKKNKKVKKAMIKKYQTLLLNLSKNNLPLSQDEKKIAALFGPDANPSDFKAAAARIRCQSGLKEHFKAGLIRSGSVIGEFKRIFRSHGLPVDLVYLPCVESSFNFKAYSKFGAAGIWQFTHSTGRHYMKIGYVVDERRDPYISTDAAARLLKKNHADLKEWPLAITAYNHGRAGMMRAKKAKGSYEEIIKSYRSRSFKFASRNFYSEFMAARTVAKNPQKYFGNIVLRNPITFQTIKTKGYLPVKKLAEKLGLTVQDIQTLNPALRKPVFTGQKHIPKNFYLNFPETLALTDIHTHINVLYKTRQKPSRFHRVQKGDSAGAIARLHSVNLQDLILANSLGQRATIYIGQNLRIPAKDERILAKKEDKTDIPLEKMTVKERLVEHKNLEPVFEPLAKPLEQHASVNLNIVTSNLKVFQFHQEGDKMAVGIIRVEPEETLGHYADWLDIPTRKIRVLNKFKYGTPISIGQKIKLPLAKKTALEFEEQRFEFHKEIEEDFFESFSIQGVDIYEVKNGDNIWMLCINELEIPFWLLKKYNPELKFDTLHPLQKIKYPLINKRSQTP